MTGYLMILFPILISSLLVPAAFSIPRDHYLNTNCTKNQTNTTYPSNLQNLFHDLYNITPIDGFGNSSSGSTNQIFGLSLCRGDVSTKDCQSCVKKAIKEITDGCPISQAAIIWRDYCYLKYSDYHFFGKIDINNNFRLLNTKNATDQPKFHKAVVELLFNLSRNASDKACSKDMFARGEKILFSKEKNVTLYGMAQCSRDLSSKNCQKCLDWAVNHLPWDVTLEKKLYATPRGGRTLTGSCNVRYEIYPFLQNKITN